MIVDASLGWRLPGRRGLLEVGVNNLFDQDFRYEDPYFGDPSEPAMQPFQPERFVYGRVTLSF
jgi:outer membrane receptor protein involved in Fe transport